MTNDRSFLFWYKEKEPPCFLHQQPLIHNVKYVSQFYLLLPPVVSVEPPALHRAWPSIYIYDISDGINGDISAFCVYNYMMSG